MNSPVGRVTFVAWGLVLVLAVGAVLAYQQSRLRAVTEQAGQLERKLAATQHDVAAARTRVGVVEGGLADTQQDVRNVDRSVKKQAAGTLDVKAVTQQALPSVVTVYCGDAQGSGFAIDVDDPPPGYSTGIVTNEHVIDECTFTGGPEPSVRQGEMTPATTLWTWDEDNDLALLFVDAMIPPLATAPSPEQGDPVVAIGSPYGLDESVTTGIVSQVYPRYFQTDASVNPGNSGGPLLDRHGKVLGVTTFKLGDQGTNFAVRMRVRCEELLDC